MIIKAAYYLRQMPTQIAIVLPNGAIMHTNLSPFRAIQENELSTLKAAENQVVRKNILVDRIPPYVLRFYGLEEVQ